jgi:hypothetical protein
MGFLSKLFGSKPPPPPPPRPERLVVEQRPWVMVYDVPTEAGWTRSDDEREGEDFVVQVLKLARTDDRLVLLAKDYTGAVGDEDLRARDWNAQYAQIFQAVTSVQLSDGKQTLMDREVDALDVVAEGTSADGPQRIRERYASIPGHQLIITAAGTIAAHERFAKDIERWFEGIAFRPRPSR